MNFGLFRLYLVHYAFEVKLKRFLICSLIINVSATDGMTFM